MPFDPFRVDLDGVRELSQLHADAASSLKDAITDASGVAAAHGSIGTRATGAFDAVLEARRGALSAASHTCGQLSHRLGMAVGAYARGDESGAAAVRAVAEAMDAPTGPGSLSASVASGTIGAAESSGLADALSQVEPQDDSPTPAVQAGRLEHSGGIGEYASEGDDVAERSTD